MISLIDSAGTSVVEYTYDAWGRVFPATGTLASTLGQANPFRYRGYYFDTESGFYYLQSRYYDPMTGRFINADDTSILQMTQGELLGGNLYAYCGNNGVMNVDPDGYVIRTNPVSQTDNPTKDSFYYPWLFVGTRSFQRPFLQYDTIFGYWISRFSMLWPHKGKTLDRSRYTEENGPQRNFGLRVHPKYKDIRFHYGIDLGGKDYEGDEIIASASGTITAMKSNIADAGNYIEIKHSIFGVTFKSRYLHLQSFRGGLKVGDSVKGGTVIGYMGKSGTSDVHLHFEVFIESDSTFFKGFLFQKPYTKSYYFNPLLLNYK